ncbi:MAG: DUF4339 domain-containing protein [Pelagibaca sp.]
MPLGRRGVTLCGLAMLVPQLVHAADVKIYIADGGLATGPFGEKDIRDRLKSQAEAARTLVWHQGMADWALATDVSALSALIASLPFETPMDFEALIIGTWRDNSATLMAEDETQGGERAVPGWKLLEFKNDRTYTLKAYAQWVSRFFVPGSTRPPIPGQVPVRPPLHLVDNTITFTVSGSGTYRLVPVDARSFDLFLDGTNKGKTNDQPAKPISVKDRTNFTVIGPDHLMSQFGENYYRRSL